MNAHPQQRSAAALRDVPGIGGVRARVRFARADDEHPANGAVLHRLPRPHDVRHKRLGLRVAVPHAVGAHRVEDGLGLGPVAAQRLGADNGLSGLGGRNAGGGVSVIWQANNDEVDIVTGDGLVHVGRPRGNGPLGRKLGRPSLGPREVHDDLLPRHVAQRAHEEFAHEPAAEHCDSDHLGRLLSCLRTANAEHQHQHAEIDQQHECGDGNARARIVAQTEVPRPHHQKVHRVRIGGNEAG